MQLASAVPVEGQRDRFKPRCEGMAYPTEEDFRAAVTAVRPEDADAFSLQRLRTGWTEEVGTRVGTWPERLQVEAGGARGGLGRGGLRRVRRCRPSEARTLVEGALDDIEATVAELASR